MDRPASNSPRIGEPIIEVRPQKDSAELIIPQLNCQPGTTFRISIPHQKLEQMATAPVRVQLRPLSLV
jgi:hypothetical protein